MDVFPPDNNNDIFNDKDPVINKMPSSCECDDVVDDEQIDQLKTELLRMTVSSGIPINGSNGRGLRNSAILSESPEQGGYVSKQRLCSSSGDRTPERGRKSSLTRFNSAPFPEYCETPPCDVPGHKLRTTSERTLQKLSCSPTTAFLERDLYRRSMSPFRIARDPVQPKSGTISMERCNLTENELEDQDIFPVMCNPRQRAMTCPDRLQSWRNRRHRNKSLDRPPTPPPGGVENFNMEQQVTHMLTKEKLHIPDRQLEEVFEND